MEVTLIIVTLVSLALAMAMGVIAWRLLQEERLRADARVAALEQGLTASLRTNPPLSPMSTASGTATASPDESFHEDTDWLAQFPSSSSGAPLATAAAAAPVAAIGAASTTYAAATTSAPASAAAIPRDTSTVAIEDEGDVANSVEPARVELTRAGMFAQAAEPTENGGLSRRLVAIVAVAAVMICAVLAVWTIGRVMSPRVDPRTSAAGATAAGPAALELVSLRHVQQDGTLTITGLVRNPYGGVPQERLTAVVFFFDGQGGFLSSSRAPLDFRALAPGEESPFQVSAPVPQGVARYRVSFRREEGAIVPHVDRRQQQEASRS